VPAVPTEQSGLKVAVAKKVQHLHHEDHDYPSGTEPIGHFGRETLLPFFHLLLPREKPRSSGRGFVVSVTVPTNVKSKHENALPRR
jgi:hypothetical protein